MVKIGYCAVLGCRDRESSRHRFPDPSVNKDLFQKWLEACGSEKLFSMEPKRVYQTRKVCHIHFRPEDKSSNMYFKKGTYPMLHLPSSNTVPEQPLTLSKDKHGEKHQRDESILSTPQPSCSKKPKLVEHTEENVTQSVPEVPLPIAIKEEPIQNEDMLEHIQMDLSDKNNTEIKSEPNCDEIVDKEFAEQCLEYTLKFLKQCSSSDVRQEIEMLEKLKNRWPQLK